MFTNTFPATLLTTTGRLFLEHLIPSVSSTPIPLTSKARIFYPLRNSIRSPIVSHDSQRLEMPQVEAIREREKLTQNDTVCMHYGQQGHAHY